MTAHPPSRSLAAIVFTDIVGYSAIVHRDEALGAQLLDRQRTVVRRIVPQFHGREVETAGDSFLLEFSSALAAVEAVIAIQQALARDAAQPPVVLRASVHLGDVEHRGREVYGDGVNVAARLLPHSPEGGIALSGAVRAVIRGRLEALRSMGTPALKNIASPIEIFVLDPAALRSLTIDVPERAAATLSRKGGPHGLMLATLAQALVGLYDLFIGFGAIVLPLHAVDPKHPENHLSLMYLGIGANLIGVALLWGCYRLLRASASARTFSLLLNSVNLLFLFALMNSFAQFSAGQGERWRLPLEFVLFAPAMSVALLAYLLHPRVSAQFVAGTP